MTKTYTVTIRFQFPAWNDKAGIPYDGITAATKAEAIKRVRRLAERDGHIPETGKGRVTLTAREAAM
jgi:hypothetical protein